MEGCGVRHRMARRSRRQRRQWEENGTHQPPWTAPEERRELPPPHQRGPGQSPGRTWVLVHFELEKTDVVIKQEVLLSQRGRAMLRVCQ